MLESKVRIWVLAAPLLWGLVFVGVDRVLQYTDAFQLVTIRFMMIAIIFTALLVARPSLRPTMTRRDWGLAWLAGLLAVPLSQFPIVSAQNFLDPALASVIVTTAPATAAILGPLLLNERVSPRQAAGFVLAFAGAAIVIITGAGGASFELRDILGAAIGVITPVAWALYTILLKRIGSSDPFVTVGVGLSLGTVFLIPWLPSSIGVLGSIPLDGWIWLGYLAFLGTFLSYLVWFHALRYLDANQTSAYMYLVPIAALAWSLLILGSVPPPVTFVGAAVVLIGVALTQSKTNPAFEEVAP
jgi:drug/metabolite transporter (DMT)-like permease